MNLPMMRFSEEEQKPILLNFGGLNRNEAVRPGQMPACWNMSLDQLPYLMPREPRSLVIHHAETPNGILGLAKVVGTQFLYNGVLRGYITSSKKCMLRFNDRIFILPDKKYYDITTGEFGDVGVGTYPAAGSCPDMDWACVHANRVFGVKKNAEGYKLYGCKQGDIFDWTTTVDAEGGVLETGAYWTDIAAEGDFVGCVDFQSHVTIFTTRQLYELYGNKPSNFKVIKVCETGCSDYYSIAEVKSALYFRLDNDIYRYSGGQPEIVSQDLNLKGVLSSSAGGDGKKYYLSVQFAASKALYVYDPSKMAWCQEDDLHVMQFDYIDKKVIAMCYGAAGSTDIYEFGSGNEKVSWWFQTERFTEFIHNKKVNSSLEYRVRAAENDTTMEVFTKVDEGNFASKYVNADLPAGMATQFVPVLPGECDNYTVKVSGAGRVIFMSLQRNFVISGE